MFNWSVISACIVGDDLHVAHVSASPLGVRARTGCVLERFLTMGEAEAASAVRRLCPGGRVPQRVLLTCAPRQCAVRPMALTTAQWPKARAEVVASIDRLLPLSPEDAAVGLYDIFSPSVGGGGGVREAVGGRLVGVRRAQVQPWLDALRRATGRERVTLLAPQMCALGLDIRDEPAAVVVETDSAVPVAHRFEHGLPVASSETTGATRRLALPGGPVAEGDEQIEPGDLAVAAALAERSAGEVFAPLEGRTPARARRWAAAGIAACLAVAGAIAAQPIYAARLERSIERAQRERAEMMEAYQQTRQTRERTERYQALLERGVGRATAGWEGVLPTLDDAVGALAHSGFLYRLEMGESSVTMVGEASEVRSVLQRLEESPWLRSVALTAPLTNSPSGEALDVFSIRAERVRKGGAR